MNKREFDYELLFRLYILEDNNSQQICKILSSGSSTINRELNKYNLVKLKKDNIKNKSFVNTKFYRTWQRIKSNCDNVYSRDYSKIGKLGIKYDLKWENFNGFYEDMYKEYQDDLILQRIDKTKDYSMSNCRWSTYKEVNNNKSDNISVTYNDKTYKILEISKLTGLSPSCIYTRYKNGWTIEEIFEIPVLTNNKDTKGRLNWSVLNKKEQVYPNIFNWELKEKILYRDNWKCTECGITYRENQLISSRGLSIHHIDYNKQNCNEDNLISLCSSCHGRTNYNRDKWKKHFKEIIRKKYKDVNKTLKNVI